MIIEFLVVLDYSTLSSSNIMVLTGTTKCFQKTPKKKKLVKLHGVKTTV